MKKSFILHRDSLDILDELTDEQSGKLFKAIKDFQNGIEPDLDVVLKMVFIPFKNQFIRENKDWEGFTKKQSDKGKKSAESRKKATNSTAVNTGQPLSTSSTYSVSVSDSVNVSDKINIDFVKLLSFLNSTLNRQFKTINKKVKASFLARLKEGYTKEDIVNAIRNASRDQYHIETNYKYLTPEFFSRADKLDRFGTNETEVIDWAKIREALPPSEVHMAKQVPDLMRHYCEKYGITQQELLTLHDTKQN